MQTISLRQLKETFPGTWMVDYGDDFFICNLTYPEGKELTLMYPCRFDGSVSLYCIEGELSLTIGIDKYTAVKDSFAVSLPGDIIRLERKPGYTGPIHMHIMAISSAILSEPEIAIMGLQRALRNRMIHAEGPYKSMIRHFREIIADLTQYPHKGTKKSFTCLITAMCIEIKNAWGAYATEPDNNSASANEFVSRFISLVTADASKHKDISYYAQKMGLTPKYLSASIKQASGKTAGEWISEYVILEAKNLLKYTTSPIKEIAFTLGFESQMSFYRYFLRHAGCTPTDYRRQ